jgi:uncharacterized protein (DUF58 family)
MGSGSELLSLRDYQAGDPLHAIDWKATAKLDKTVVRSYSREQQLEMVVLLDCGGAGRLNCGAMDRLHHYINCASRLIRLAIINEDRVGCITFAGAVVTAAPMASGAKAMPRLHQLLSGVRVVAEESNPLSAALETRRLLRHRGLIVLLTALDHSEPDSQLIKAAQLLATKHHVVIADIEDEAINRMVSQPSAHWTHPYGNFAALEYRRNREVVKSRLKRAGITVVTAPPERLDQAVLKSYLGLRLRSAV